MTAPQPTVRTHGTIVHVYDFEPSNDRTARNYRGEEVAVVYLAIERRDGGSLSIDWTGVPRLSSGKWGRAHRTGSIWFGQFPEWLHPLIDAVPQPVVTWEGQDR